MLKPTEIFKSSEARTDTTKKKKVINKLNKN